MESTPKGSKKTVRESAESFEQQSKKRAPELQNLPLLPECAQHIWDWFMQLHRKRTYGQTANPITWLDLHAWSMMTGIKPLQWELDAIDGIDLAFRASLNSKE